MATSVMSHQSSSVMTQHFRRDLHQRRNEITEITSPDGDLQDVEADFQSLVNEMVKDSSKRALKTAEAFSHITTSSSFSGNTYPASRRKQLSCPRPVIPAGSLKTRHTTALDPSIVVAMPARVVPDGEVTSNVESEVVIEKQMRVKDRIRKLEEQLSQEGNEPPQPPEAIMPRTKSGSIRNLAEQFEQTEDPASVPRIITPILKAEELIEAKNVKERASALIDQPEESISTCKVEDLNFKNVKEVASMFQDPFTPVTIKPPAPFSDSDLPEAMSPIPVLPPAMRKSSSRPSMPQMESTSVVKSEIHPPLPWKNEETLQGVSRKEAEVIETAQYFQTLSQTSAEMVIQQPIQYSAQVRCEVRSGVCTPEVAEHQQLQRQQEDSESVMNSNSTSGIFQNTHLSSSSASGELLLKGATKSTFRATAPTPLAKTTAKPPRAESADSALPKFSLLRSASAGSVGDALQVGMARTKSEKDIPKFTVKKLKSPSTVDAKVWSPGGGLADEKDGPTKIEPTDLPSFKDIPPVWTPARAGSASPSIGRKEYNKIKFEGTTLTKKPSQENVSAPKPEESFAWKDKEAERIKASSFITSTTLPRVQSPTVTLLQKRREGYLPGQKPDYLQSDEPLYKSEEKLYTIKREYESDDEELGSRKFAVLGPKKVDGVGPTTRDGVPIALKSGVKSEHQGEWYRRMFDSLHKVKDEDYIVIKYKSPKGTTHIYNPQLDKVLEGGV